MAASAPARQRPVAPNASERLQAIAARLFRDVGYSDTSMRDIAKRARVEASAIYYHFPSKQALLDAVLDAAISRLQEIVQDTLDALPAMTPPRERLRAAIASHTRWIQLHGDYSLASRRLMGHIPPASRRKHEAARAAYGEYWQALLEDAAEKEPFRSGANLVIVRMFLLGALNWTSEWFDSSKKSPEELADVLCGILFDGLAQHAPAAQLRPRQRGAG